MFYAPPRQAASSSNSVLCSANRRRSKKLNANSRKLTSAAPTPVYQNNHADDEKPNGKGSSEKIGNEEVDDEKGRIC
jgi:hypothetical protein